MHISFENFDVTANGTLRVDLVKDVRRELLIQLPWSFVPDDDLLALAMSTFVGRRYQSVHFDLDLGPGCLAVLEQATGARVEALPGQDRRRRPGSATALSFSGGFDSLAARAVLPSDVELVSLDLGGRFARERDFFERFSPHVVATNLVELGLNRNHWSFMLFGLILLRDELDLGTYATGGILGSALPRMLRNGLDQAAATLPQFRHLGVTMFNPVAGVTEVGALALATLDEPTSIPASLASVANPKEEKAFRKSVMVEAVTRALELPTPRLPQPFVRPWFAWGDYYATDLSSLFVMKQLGTEVIEPSYAGGVPQRVAEAVDELSLDFQLRVNPDAYQGVPGDRLAGLYERLASRGIRPWGRRDWEEAAAVDALVRSRAVSTEGTRGEPASPPVAAEAPTHMLSAASRPQGRPTDS